MAVDGKQTATVITYLGVAVVLYWAKVREVIIVNSMSYDRIFGERGKSLL